MARIYLSATRFDLSAECVAVKTWLTNNGHEPVDSYIPDSRLVLDSCLADIDKCDLYLLILGYYYGERPETDNPENLSYTHLEFRHARNIPRIVLRRSGIPDVSRSSFGDPNEAASVQAFHKEVSKGVRPARFADLDELIDKLREGLSGELRRLGLAPGAAALLEPLRRASRDLLAWPTTLPGGAWLQRPELEVLRQRIHQSPHSLTLVLGEPGCGKSALLARLGQEIQAEGVPVLGIKADFLPDDTLSQQALSQYLELPIPLLAAVQSLAEVGAVLVLLDQLDALADLVVQHSARLRVLLNLIHDLAHIPNVHVVASCRAFEQRHDPSLRHLEAELLTLELPAWETVDAVLQARGVQAGGWNPEMRETLRSPHVLDTFLSLLASTDEPGLLHGFQGMLQVQWERKVLNNASGGRKPLLLDLARLMAEREMLWLPLALFEDRFATVRELVADGLLRLEEGSGRIQFRHQTLYEFVRARAFLDDIGSLTETVLAGQGSLRIRPQLWHALIYLRQVAPDRYQAELERLWMRELRPHLRMLLIEFLGMQTAPFGAEIQLAIQNFDDPWFQRRFLVAVVGSPGWFEQLAPGYLPMLMARPEQEAAVVLPILDQALAFAPHDVLALLDGHWLPHVDKDVLSWRALAMGSRAPQDVAWVDRLARILARTDLAAWTVIHVAGVVSAVLPEEAPRLIAAWLDRQWRKARLEVSVPDGPPGEASELDLYSSRQAKLATALLGSRELHNLPAIAEAAPQAFVQAIWPVFLDMLEAVTGEARPFVVGYRKSAFLDDGLDEDTQDRLERPLLEAIFLSMTNWAKAQPDAFLDFMRAEANRDLLLVQRLLARGLVHCASGYPAIVLDFLCYDPRRLVLGPYSDHHRDSRKLIQAVVPYLDQSQLQRLEEVFVNWHRYGRDPDDDAETRRRRLRWDRQDRLRLLRSLPREFMSRATLRLVEEEERAFPDLEDRDIWFTGMREVTSPVSVEQMAKGSDEDVINIFAELTDEHGWDHPRHQWGPIKGGAIQAGRELARLAETDAERAVRLVRRLQPGLNDGPVSDVLRNLKKAGYGCNDIYALIEELSAKGFGSDSFRQAAAHTVEEAVCEACPVPESLLSVMEGWLVSVDPGSQDNSGNKERDGSLLWGHGALSSLPHGNFPVLAALSRACLVSKPPLMDRWLGILEGHLLRSESPRVWASIAWRYLRWLNLAEPIRAQAFLDHLFLDYPTVLGTVEGIHLMAYFQYWITPDHARRWLDHMEQVGGQGVQGYGEVLMLRHALFPAEEWPRLRVRELTASTEEGTAKQRAGIAYAVVHLWSEPGHRNLAHGYLLQLLGSQEEHVLHALANIFLTQSLFPDQPTRELLDGLCTHRALLRDQRAEHLGEHLEALVEAEPERVARLCQAVLDEAGEAMGNLATSWYLSGEPFTAIALALQDMGEPHRGAGLALFERMLEFNLPQARELTLSLDKRMPNLTNPPRASRRRRQRKSVG